MVSNPNLTARRIQAPPALRIALYVLAGSITFSLLGSLTLILYPAALKWFGPYLQTLVMGPTWIYMISLPVIAVLLYGPKIGAPKIGIAFLIGAGLGAGSELLGTTTGFPFGAYGYTHWLGPQIAGHVPFVIPLSWFALSIVCFDLAGRLVRSRAARILLGALFMVCWDVALDPAMNGAGTLAAGAPVGGMETFWYYPEGAFYYGMPLQNWIGWFVVSLCIMTGYELVIGDELPAPPTARLFYLLNVLFPAGLCLLYGLYVPALVGLLIGALPFLLTAPSRLPVSHHA